MPTISVSIGDLELPMCRLPNGKMTYSYRSEGEAEEGRQTVIAQSYRKWRGYKPRHCPKCGHWHVIKAKDAHK